MMEEIIRRLGSCSNNMAALFAELVASKGSGITDEDVFDSHMAWVRAQGGSYSFTYKDLTDRRQYQGWAFQLREIARANP